MKTYTVIRGSSGEIGCTVTDPLFAGVRLLQHIVFHSPAGFETGCHAPDNDGGPADLALAILAEHFEVGEKQVAEAISYWRMREDGGPAERALLFHQPFKTQFIAPRQIERGQSYEIQSGQIESWLGELLHKFPAGPECLAADVRG